MIVLSRSSTNISSGGNKQIYKVKCLCLRYYLLDILTLIGRSKNFGANSSKIIIHM